MKKSPKKLVSFRLTETCRQSLERMAEKTNHSHTALVELAVADLELKTSKKSKT